MTPDAHREKKTEQKALSSSSSSIGVGGVEVRVWLQLWWWGGGGYGPENHTFNRLHVLSTSTVYLHVLSTSSKCRGLLFSVKKKKKCFICMLSQEGGGLYCK